MTLPRFSLRAWFAISSISLVLCGFALGNTAAQNAKSAGLILSDQATSADVGLPIYPGAKPYKKPGNDSDSGRVSAWLGGSGFKVAAMQMEASDPPQKIAEFYHKALGKYGKVLDCTNGASSHDDSEKALTCGDDKPDEGGMLFKVGTKAEQHLVAIDPHGAGSTFSLVYFRVPNN
jgi:hypothetical protein